MVDMLSGGYRNVLRTRPSSGVGDSASGYIFVSTDGSDLTNSLGSGFPIIITAWQVSLQDKLQALEAFGEHVHGYAFGKGVGSASIEGMSLENEVHNPAHQVGAVRLVSQYADKLRAMAAAKAGSLVRVSGPGALVLSGVARALAMSIESQQSNILRFQLQLVILDTVYGAS